MTNRETQKITPETWADKGEEGPAYIVSAARLAGGMSPVWGQPDRPELNLFPADLKKLPEEEQDKIKAERREAADSNINQFLERYGILPQDVIVIKPQADRNVEMGIVNADEVPRGSSYIEDTRPAAMMYSTDQERVLAIRPADCPVLTGYGYTKDHTPVHFLIHLGWQDEEAGFAEQGLTFLQKNMECDLSSINFAITPGGESFEYTRPTDPREGRDERFQHPDWQHHIHVLPEDEQPASGVKFTIDMKGFVKDQLRKFGVTSEQILVDESDTTLESSGYSSHQRASEGIIPPTRDLVLVMAPDYLKEADKRSVAYLRRYLGHKASQG